MQIAEIITENKLLWQLANSSYDGIFMTDALGAIVYCNDAYLRISGLHRQDILGKNIIELVERKEIPDACSPEVIRTRKPVTKVIDYYQGLTALVTSTPVFDKMGELIRVYSNVRDITELLKMKEQLQNTRALNDEYCRRLSEVEEIHGEVKKFLVFSPAMRNIVHLAGRIASISSPVLIEGESGVGKDVLARFIHDSGGKSDSRPFVQINCSAIPETLLESELFGYEPGAFTGASKVGKAGLFALANNGTLFLDEIGEMPLALQVKLLNVLQTNSMYRLGGTKKIQIQTRVIAATNNRLERLIDEGRFRRDLYYRLNVIPIYIPPLRERPDDLIPLLLHFADRANRQFNLNKKFTPRVLDFLREYTWPGNVRELRNVVENMIILSETDTIDERSIPLHITKSTGKSLFIDTPDYFDSYDLETIMAEVEKEVIHKAFDAFGSMRNTAKHLGIDLSTLVRKKQKYQL